MTPRADYGNQRDVPELVARAVALAAELGFENSCHPGYGRLLRSLAARGGRILETGSGCGVGTAWMLSGMPVDASLVTVEIDPTQAVRVSELFAHDSRARVIHGDARQAFGLGPFDLIFNDGGPADAESFEAMVGALSIGGTAVKDDMIWLRPASDDPRKALWMGHPALTAVEVMVAPPDWAAIIAVRTE